VSVQATVTVCSLDEIPSGAARKFEVAGIAVSVVRIGDDLYALGDVCSHAEVSLSEGEVWCDELELECPKHGSAFSLLTGEPSTLPATQPVPVFDASVVDGKVMVTITIDPDVSEGDEAS
jgi:3-phenylpropionate/trans-cinnamate dioxygenase ferredoxin subunit